MAFEVTGVKEIIKTLNSLPKELDVKKRRLILRQSAVIFKDAARRLAPVGKKWHARYKDGKLIGIYSPGNLRDSIGLLTFRKAKTAVFVGAKTRHRGAKVEAEGQKLIMADGYYAAMVEEGHVYKTEFGSKKTPAQPFMRPAFVNNQGKVREDIARRVEKVVKAWLKKNTVSK